MTPKFRAWDTKHSEWWKSGTDEDPLTLSINLDGSISLLTDDDGGKNGLWEHDVTVAPGRFILEMFTGLKDKNGKEIYEGDLMLWKFNGESRIYVVEWFDNLARFLGVRGEETTSVPSDSFSKVIGNVHENPELLKEAKP